MVGAWRIARGGSADVASAAEASKVMRAIKAMEAAQR